MRLRNNIFAEAFKWLKKNWDGIKYQKDLALKIGVSEDTITRIMRDKTEVTDDFLCKFNEAFDNVFNYQWLRGEDNDNMLAIDVINPTKTAQTFNPDYSSLMNAIIAAKDDAIESLKRELQTKDDLIFTLQQQLADKDDYINTLKERLIEYRKIIDAHNGFDFSFPIRASEKPEKRQINK